MEDCIKKGWLAIVNVDVALLDKKKRYSPHSIVVTKLAPRFVEFHDPGLPPEPSRRVPRALFAKALHQAELVLLRWPLPRG
ncbi:MAG: hypothetical protein KGH97_00860 [Patescibacteria group bacterium]|nr:hypothetical protein [Patescibacteria group bacterium]